MSKTKSELYDENGAIEKINDMSQEGFRRFMVIPSVKVKKRTPKHKYPKTHLTPEDSKFVNDFTPVVKDDAIARVRRLFEFGFEYVVVFSTDFDQTIGYKVRTVGELLNFIQTNKAKFPLGADTPLVIADDEGNSMHKLFSVEQGKVDGKNSLVLSYDMYGE